MKQLEVFCATHGSDAKNSRGTCSNYANKNISSSSDDVYGRTLVRGLFHSASQVVYLVYVRIFAMWIYVHYLYVSRCMSIYYVDMYKLACIKIYLYI